MKVNCPLCHAPVSDLVRHFSPQLDQALLDLIRQEHPQWKPVMGGCTRCVDHYYNSIHYPEQAAEGYVLPTPLRLHVSESFRGSGVTICFIDSGFYPHPDLTKPRNRILKIQDITSAGLKEASIRKPSKESWHGTMTSVVAAGNGWLSGGVYRGVASEANLVLLKVMDREKILGEDIARAIHWAIENRQRYNIRIINLSVSDDQPLTLRESQVDQAVEQAVSSGIVVVAAAGNDAQASLKPPASAPAVITVGGVDDHNTLGAWPPSAYHSTFGITLDGVYKPELIAPSIWLAAPILPGSDQSRESHLLYEALQMPENEARELLKELQGSSPFNLDEDGDPGADFKSKVSRYLQQQRYILPDYQHADGTSFAAPIVCSIVAQILEANPELSPSMVKQLLFSTATKVPHIPEVRQGYGIINAALALAAATEESHHHLSFHPTNGQNGNLKFTYHDHDALQVEFVGTLNKWEPGTLPFTRDAQGLWQIELLDLPRGRYLYKFLVDGHHWVVDPLNPWREPDGYNSFNSVAIVE